MVSAFCGCRQDTGFRKYVWANAGMQDVKGHKVHQPLWACRPGKEGDIPQALKGDLQALPRKMFDFCVILGISITQASAAVCGGVAVSLLLTLPTLHLWHLQLQQQPRQHSLWGSGANEQLLVLQRRLKRTEPPARSCCCPLMSGCLRSGFLIPAASPAGRETWPACPSHALGQPEC